MANFKNVGTENGKKVEFTIDTHLGTIAHNAKTNWNKEVNIVRWNEGEAKLDIREWDSNHERMSKGITLNETEAGKLTRILSSCFPDDCVRRTYRTDRAPEVHASEDIPFEETVDENHQEDMMCNADEDLPLNEMVDNEPEDYNDYDREEVTADEDLQNGEIAC